MQLTAIGSAYIESEGSGGWWFNGRGSPMQLCMTHWAWSWDAVRGCWVTKGNKKKGGGAA
ncbi:hypothetical protein HaLaN_00304, partial [Haematococcus lacustris]